MRNWNLEFAATAGAQSTRLLSTYEELKHYYEKGNVEFGNWFTIYLWGIETNFNFERIRYAAKFTIYLWGIETQVSLWKKARFLGLLSTYEELKLFQ